MFKKISLLSICLLLAVTGITKPEDTLPNIDQKEQVVLVFFTLEGNNLNMEQYNLNEIKEFVTNISSEVSEKQTVMRMDMKEKGLPTRSIRWNQENLGEMNIVAGRGEKSATYNMNLESMFKGAEEEDVTIICFNCDVKHKKTKETESRWESLINIQLPVQDNKEVGITFVFDRKIKAACCFFMNQDEFNRLHDVPEYISKTEALKSQLLTTHHIPSKGFSSQVASLWSNIKTTCSLIASKLFAKLIAIKVAIGNSFNACNTYLFKKA